MNNTLSLSPLCAYKMRVSSSVIAAIVIALLAGFSLITHRHFDGEALSMIQPVMRDTSRAIHVSAGELLAAYKQNGVTADKKYKGKVLWVTGKIARIINGYKGRYIMLNEGDGTVEGVQCFFTDDDKDDIAAYKKGDVVTIRGECSGRVKTVQLHNCSFPRRAGD